MPKEDRPGRQYPDAGVPAEFQHPDEKLDRLEQKRRENPMPWPPNRMTAIDKAPGAAKGDEGHLAPDTNLAGDDAFKFEGNDGPVRIE